MLYNHKIQTWSFISTDLDIFAWLLNHHKYVHAGLHLGLTRQLEHITQLTLYQEKKSIDVPLKNVYRNGLLIDTYRIQKLEDCNEFVSPTQSEWTTASWMKGIHTQIAISYSRNNHYLLIISHSYIKKKITHTNTHTHTHTKTNISKLSCLEYKRETHTNK